MDVYDSLLTNHWIILGHIIYWPIVIFALIKTPWRERSCDVKQIWPILSAALLLLWQLNAPLSVGISIHLLGATLMTVLFGWQLAIVGLTSVLLGTTLINTTFSNESSWLAIGLNGVTQVLVPTVCSYHIVKQVFLRLPHNFFIYIYLVGFANAMLSIAMVGLSSTLVLALASEIPLNILTSHYLSAYLLIIFPEAFITGALLTIVVVYRSQWALSFDDERYLKK